VWQYDQVGNWVFTDQNGFDENRTVNADNEYDTITGLIPVYDANGNMTSDGDKDYTYDWANRLVEVLEGGATTVEYTYDALNRRVTKLATQQTTYIYDGGQVIEEYVGTSLERTYVYGAYIDDPIMVDHSGQRFYYVKDRQYSITAITDASGNIVELYEYSAFGLMTIFDSSNQDITATGSTIGNPYGFTGRRWDQETELWYYRNRMYSPELGRFMQRDPEGYVDGMNLYAYVKNNPLRYLDPMGLRTVQENTDSFSYLDQKYQEGNLFAGPGAPIASRESTDAGLKEYELHKEFFPMLPTGKYQIRAEYTTKPISIVSDVIDFIGIFYKPIKKIPLGRYERSIFVEPQYAKYRKVSIADKRTVKKIVMEKTRIPNTAYYLYDEDSKPVHVDTGIHIFKPPDRKILDIPEDNLGSIIDKIKEFHGAEAFYDK
jgi:RHS repeat-associated protein